jgi:CheY-like chemotaxis protein
VTAKKKILLVEDEKSIIVPLKKVLQRNGYDITMSGNGQEGLEKALSEKPDLILLDVIMPVMDGITMFKNLREDPWGKNAKVIMLTNLADPQSAAESKTLKSNGYLIKTNLKLEDVVQKVKSTLES